MAGRERERQSRAQNETQSQNEAAQGPFFAAPKRVEASDDLSHSVQQTLGPFSAVVNTSHLSALIGIPKQPQTPVDPSPGQDFFRTNHTLPEMPGQHNGSYPGHHKSKKGPGPGGSQSAKSSSHSKSSSVRKSVDNSNSKSGKDKTKSSKSHSARSDNVSNKGSTSSSSVSSQKTSKTTSRPSLDLSKCVNSVDSKKEKNNPSKNDKLVRSKADLPHSMPKISDFTDSSPLKHPNPAHLSVDLERSQLFDTNASSFILDGKEDEVDAVQRESNLNATRLATDFGDMMRPPSRTEQSKDEKVQDILRIYTEHLDVEPIRPNISTPIKETKLFFHNIDQVHGNHPPTIDEVDEEPEDVADAGLSDDLQISDDSAREEDNSTSTKEKEGEEDTETVRNSETAMVKGSDEESGDSSSGSEDEETPSSSDSEESGSEESSNGSQTRDPSDRPKESKSYSLLSQINKVKNEQKFTPRSGPFSENIESSNRNSSSNVPPNSHPLDNVKRNSSSPDLENNETTQHEERTEHHDADDEEDEHEPQRKEVKRTGSTSSASPAKCKSTPKSSRSYEQRKAPGKPSTQKSGGAQADKVSSQGKVPPTVKSTKSFGAGKKAKENTKAKSKPEKSESEESASKTKRAASSGKSSSAKPSMPKAKERRSKSKKEVKFTSKKYITSSDSEEDVRTNNSIVDPTPEHIEHKAEKPVTHRTNRDKSPQVRGARKEPKGPPHLSKIRETKFSEERRRVPQKNMDTSEDEPHPVLSPVNVKQEENIHDDFLPVRDSHSELSLPKGDIPHLVVSFDLALIRQLPIKEEKKSDSLLFGPSKRKDPLDTEKPSAIVKPYHTTERKSSTDSRKEKTGRPESRRSTTSRSPRRIREPPLLVQGVPEPPPDREPPILPPSHPSRILDRRRSNQHEDPSNLEAPHRRVDPLGEHEPPPKRPRTDRLDSHEESPEAMFSPEEALGGNLHSRRMWDTEGYHRQEYFGNTNCRSFDDRQQQFTSDDYLAEGKRLKHLADTQTDKYTQSLTYFEAALSFIMCGNNFERDPGYPDEKAIRMYSDTCKIIKWLIGIHSGSEGRSNDKKLAVLCYRFQALLNMRMYKLKRAATSKLARELNEHFKTSKQSQQTQSSWNPSSKYSETPSPMSPTPSPAGSVGSVGSMGSQGSNSSDIPPATTSSKVGPGMNVSSGGTMVPQRIYNMMNTYMTNSTYCLTSIDYWEQAETLAQENRDFFQEVTDNCRVLTLHSSILDLVQYSKYCLLKLKAL